jgi:ABC-2 type transport system permease protein
LNFSFQSGSYKKHQEKYRGKNIEVYTLAKHDKYVDDMTAGIKASLDFNESTFSKYPYDDIRVIEFPASEGDYSASLMANNIPCSEILFSLNNKKMKSKLNLPFYVMAHELTHEWFGNQLMPAKGPGAKMLTESITEFLTLNIYESKLGESMKRSFLDVQLKRYMNGKRSFGHSEKPLVQVETDQEYIAYGKGTLALNRLAQAIGEDKILRLLGHFLNTFKAKKVYPSGKDFVQFLYTNTSIESHDLINELFEQIVIYDHQLVSVTSGNENEIELLIDISSKGKASPIQVIEIAQKDSTGDILKIDSCEVNTGNNVIQLTVGESTSELILDPNYIYIDSDRENNMIKL